VRQTTVTSRRGSPTFFGDGTHLEVLSDLADEALEGELADEQLGGLLVLPVALKGARDGRVSDVHTEDLARETNPKNQLQFPNRSFQTSGKTTKPKAVTGPENAAGTTTAAVERVIALASVSQPP
tara:strand:- start:104 stop:478 length:375 start_codon:yes stop_codon:yes gene_type:complete